MESLEWSHNYLTHGRFIRGEEHILLEKFASAWLEMQTFFMFNFQQYTVNVEIFAQYIFSRRVLHARKYDVSGKINQ